MWSAAPFTRRRTTVSVLAGATLVGSGGLPGTLRHAADVLGLGVRDRLRSVCGPLLEGDGALLQATGLGAVWWTAV